MESAGREGGGEGCLNPQFCLQASDGVYGAFEVGDSMRISTETRTGWFSFRP